MHTGLQRWHKLRSCLCFELQEWLFWMPMPGFYQIRVKQLIFPRKNVRWAVHVRITNEICPTRKLFRYSIAVQMDRNLHFLFNRTVSFYAFKNNQSTMLTLHWFNHSNFKAVSLRISNLKWMIIPKFTSLARLHSTVNFLFLEVTIRRNRFNIKIKIASSIIYLRFLK